MIPIKYRETSEEAGVLAKQNQSTEPRKTEHAEEAEQQRNGSDAQSGQAGAATQDVTQPESQSEVDTNADAAEVLDAESAEGSNDSAASAREAELTAKLQDTETKLLRTLADFDNFRRRTRQEHEDLQKFAAKKVLEGLLPVVDNFERAFDAVEGKDISEDFKTGIEMVHRQLVGVLTQQGVHPMDSVGKPFDPQFHEAVMQESVEGQEAGVVLQELQKGYMIHDKVLRPAMVKVSV